MASASARSSLREGEVRSRLKSECTVVADGVTEILAAPGPGFAIVVYGITALGQDFTDDDGSIQFRSGANTITELLSIRNATPIHLPVSDIPYFRLNENEALNVLVGGTTPSIAVWTWFVPEPA